MNGRRGLVVSIVLILVVTLIPLLSSCTAKPVDKNLPLKIGFSLCMTGSAAEKCTPMGQGKLDGIKYINEELGGVEGHKIEVHWYDNGYDAAKSATVVKKLMDEGCLFFTTNASFDMSASMEIANRSGFPGMAVYSSPIITRPPKYIYAQLPDYADDWAAFTNYYMKNIWKGAGKPKMALHLLNNPTGDGARIAAKAAAADMGVEIVAIEEHSTTTISEIESLTRIKSKNPDVLYISSTPKPTSVILKNAYELKLYPGITIGSGHAGITKALVDLAGKDIAEGVYGVFPTVGWGENVPGMAKMIEYCKKLHIQAEGNLDYLVTWAEALVDAEILRQAVKNTSYDILMKGNNESWKAIKENGFMKIKGFDAAGLHGPVDFSNPDDNRGSKSVRIFQIKNGDVVPITGWVEAPLIKFESFDWFAK